MHGSCSLNATGVIQHTPNALHAGTLRASFSCDCGSSSHLSVCIAIVKVTFIMNYVARCALKKFDYDCGMSFRIFRISLNHWRFALVYVDPRLHRFSVIAQGKYGEAEEQYAKAQAIFDTTLGYEHPDVATVLNNRAACLRAQVRTIQIFEEFSRGQTGWGVCTRRRSFLQWSCRSQQSPELLNIQVRSARKYQIFFTVQRWCCCSSTQYDPTGRVPV